MLLVFLRHTENQMEKEQIIANYKVTKAEKLDIFYMNTENLI